MFSSLCYEDIFHTVISEFLPLEVPCFFFLMTATPETLLPSQIKQTKTNKMMKTHPLSQKPCTLLLYMQG